MKTIKQRINIIIGQLQSIKERVDKPEANCEDLFIQLKAIKSGINSLNEKIIVNEFNRCLNSKLSNKEKRKIENIFKEIIKK